MKSTTELLYFYGQLNSKASSEWSSKEIETVAQRMRDETEKRTKYSYERKKTTNDH